MKLKEGKGGKLIQDWAHQNLLKITCERYTIPFLSLHISSSSLTSDASVRELMQVILLVVMDSDFYSDCLLCWKCSALQKFFVSYSILTNVLGAKVPITIDSFIQLFWFLSLLIFIFKTVQDFAFLHSVATRFFVGMYFFLEIFHSFK